MFSKSEKREFLIRLGNILSDPTKIDKAVFDREVGKMPKKISTRSDDKDSTDILSLSELDACGVFNSDGSINWAMATKYDIKFDYNRLKARLSGFDHLSEREIIIFESAISTVIEELSQETYKKTTFLIGAQSDLEKQIDQLDVNKDATEIKRLRTQLNNLEQQLIFVKNHQPSKGLDKEAFFDLTPTAIKLSYPLSLSLSGMTKQILGMGYFRFKDTNVSISPGPHSTKDDPERSITGYLNNLLTNNVSHVFAVGRVFPYYAAASKKDESLISAHILEEDFTNYFIPDADGLVNLPPELKEFTIHSRPIKKIGRCITYEISINGNQPIQIHHFPIRDKQPLELTDEELAYIEQIDSEPPTSKNIHTHCRAGKGRSGQMAYLLASLNPKYRDLPHEERLARMRLEKNNDKESKSFVETDIQESDVKERAASLHKLRGFDLHFMSQLPKNLEGYSGSYLFCKDSAPKKLHYVKPDGVIEEVTINNLALFEKKLGGITKETSGTLHLSDEQIKKLITLNGDHTPIRTKTSRLPKEEMENTFERYIMYQIVLKKEIESQIKGHEQTGNNLKDYPLSIIDLMEQFQKLSFTNTKNLNDWIESVRKDRTISDETSHILANYKTVDDLLLYYVFTKEMDPEDLKVLFDLQASKRNISELIKKLDAMKDKEKTISTDVAKKDTKDINTKHESFLAHLQDAYLKNSCKLRPEDNHSLRKEVQDKIKTALDHILIEVKKKPDKDSFDRLTKKYYQCKQRLALLQRDEKESEEEIIVDKALIELSQGAEQLFNLGYEKLIELSSGSKSEQIKSIHQKLHQLSRENQLSPEKWDELKIEFIALITLVDSEKEISDIVLNLNNLFQEGRERTISIEHLFKRELLLVDRAGKSLNVFLRELKNAVQKEINKIPENYPHIEKIKEILAKIPNPKKESASLDIINTEEEYEIKRTEVIELISKLPFLITTNNPLVVLEILKRDFERLIKNNQVNTTQFEECKHRFIELKIHYYKESDKPITADKVAIDLVIKSIQDQINSVKNKDFHSQIQNQLKKTMILFQKAQKNALIIKLGRQADERSMRKEIVFFEESIEQKKTKELEHPKKPKLIVFDVDDTLLDLNKNELKRVDELIEILKYAKDNAIEIAIATNRTPALDANQPTPINSLKKIIYDRTGIEISNMLTFLDTPSIQQENKNIIKYYEEKIEKLKIEIGNLKKINNSPSINNNIKSIENEINSLNNKMLRLVSGKFTKLDSIRRYYHGFKNRDTYYNDVEGGILLDFKNPTLTKKIEIDDFGTNQEWANLFTVADALMRSDLQAPKPSLMTILRDLIKAPFEQLQKKYGALDAWEESIITIKNKQSMIKDNFSKIETFYQTRLLVHKAKYEKRHFLKEEDILFVDDQENIVKQTLEHSNYRAIKVSPPKEDSFRYMVDLNYEMGAYNQLIDNLKKDKEIFSKELSLEKYLNERDIPNFSKHQFKHSPIVLHVKMSTLLSKLPAFNSKKETQIRYKEQFIEAAIERYHELTKELQDDFVKTYYTNTTQILKNINDELKNIIQAKTAIDEAELRNLLKKLKIQTDVIIKRDAQFSQKISGTFLSSDAKVLRSMLVYALFSGKVNSLTVSETNHVTFNEVPEKNRSGAYRDAIINQSEIYSKEIHPVLSLDNTFIVLQYEQVISKILQECYDMSNFSNSNLMTEAEKSFSLDFFINDLSFCIDNKIDLSKTVEAHRELSTAEMRLKRLSQVAKYQNIVHALKGEAKTAPLMKINNLCKKVTDLKTKIENSEPFKNEKAAKLFLDKAEKYLLEKNWNVRFQWNRHMVKVDGTDKKIPATVKKQLDLISQSRITGDYLWAKEAFIKLGKEKERSWTSSTKAKEYYRMFKKNDTELVQEFENKNVNNKNVK